MGAKTEFRLPARLRRGDRRARDAKPGAWLGAAHHGWAAPRRFCVFRTLETRFPSKFAGCRHPASSTPQISQRRTRLITTAAATYTTTPTAHTYSTERKRGKWPLSIFMLFGRVPPCSSICGQKVAGGGSIQHVPPAQASAPGGSSISCARRWRYGRRQHWRRGRPIRRSNLRACGRWIDEEVAHALDPDLVAVGRQRHCLEVVLRLGAQGNTSARRYRACVAWF